MDYKRDVKVKSSMYSIKRFAPFFKKYKGIFVFDLMCASFTTFSEMVIPLILRYITNKGFEDLYSLTMNTVFKLAGLLFLLKALEVTAHYYMAYVGHVMGAMIETDMRNKVFEHLQKLSNKFYNNNKVGQIMTRITVDLFDVTEFAHHCPEEYFIGFIKLVAVFIILASASLTMALILYILIPIMIISMASLNSFVKRTFKAQRNHIGDLNASIEDSLSGIRVVKVFANEDLELEKFQDGNKKFLQIKRATYKYFALFQTVGKLYDGLMYLTVILLGSYFMINGRITPGDFLIYNLYLSTLLSTIKRLIDFTETYQKGITGLERYFELLDADIDIFDKEDAQDIDDIEGFVEFKDVSFKYDESDDYILKDINITIPKGKNIALVGPSGAGKTTLCNLIPRFYDINGGSITIDGKNITDIKLKSLRKNIGMVQQDVYLFNGTVKENILYGKPDASMDEVITASKLAGAYDFIMELPDKFDTFVGERGVRLSGGQKQRISISRVFLKNPKVLILDEATSSLDNNSEKIIQKSLEKLSKGRTTLTIAHRLSTIINSDEIIVLTEKGIVERGTHDELIKLKGIYAALYNQSKGDLTQINLQM